MNEVLDDFAALVGRELAKRWLQIKYPDRLAVIGGESSQSDGEPNAFGETIPGETCQEDKT